MFLESRGGFLTTKTLLVLLYAFFTKSTAACCPCEFVPHACGNHRKNKINKKIRKQNEKTKFYCELTCRRKKKEQKKVIPAKGRL